MSQWTTVIGTIVVDTYSVSNAESIFIAQTVLDHLPKITGSEGDVQMSVQLVSDCNRSRSRNELDVPHHGSMFRTQSNVIITIYGTLRDMSFESTIKDSLKFLNRLSKRLWVDFGTFKVISRDDGRQIDLMDGKTFLSSDETYGEWYADYLKYVNGFIDEPREED